MGSVVEQNMVNQLKKGQGETNQRLEAILTELQRTNQLLEWLGRDVLSRVAPTAGRATA